MESPPAQPLLGASLFATDAVHQIRIEIKSEDVTSLRTKPRNYVRSIVHHNGNVFSDVGIHIKGATGSFRNIDDKPALTLQFNRFDNFQRFYGLRKIHLNNSVEDPSYSNELLGSELFRASGVPAPRVTHALVELNGRKLGLYVLKEGFTEDFLAGYFNRTNGNLYDTELGHDVDQRMKRNLGIGSDKMQNDLEHLAAAAQEPDINRRWQRLEPLLDTDRFIAFMALEIMLCHKDGYSLARNNFRIYHDPGTGRMVFLPHGMDQLFGIPDLPWKPQLPGIVAKAIMDTPEGRKRYEARFQAALTHLYNVEAFSHSVDQMCLKLRPFLSHRDFIDLEKECSLVKERVAQRFANLRAQLDQLEPVPIQFQGGFAHLIEWKRHNTPISGRMEQTSSPDKISSLEIVTQSNTSASWRTKILLKRGRYRFEGLARVEAVKPLPFGRHQGAGLRMVGRDRQSDGLTGDTSWQPLTIDFDVNTEAEEIEFICELRASAGSAWFDINSLCLRTIRQSASKTSFP